LGDQVPSKFLLNFIIGFSVKN